MSSNQSSTPSRPWSLLLLVLGVLLAACILLVVGGGFLGASLISASSATAVSRQSTNDALVALLNTTATHQFQQDATKAAVANPTTATARAAIAGADVPAEWTLYIYNSFSDAHSFSTNINL